MTPPPLQRSSSVFLSNLAYFCAQTDGTYKYPSGAFGDLLKQAKVEIEALLPEHSNTMPSTKEKPTVRYDSHIEMFTLDGGYITDEQARERWDAFDCDWTHPAYTEMAKRVMAEAPKAPTPDWIPLNLNNRVRFRLTDRGREYVEELNRTDPAYSRFPLLFTPDEEGWIVEELWSFANIFGPTFYNGCDLTVEIKIAIRHDLC